ncbi:RNA 2',3'-cyclic phosphodiesterase [Gymnodinialimonas ceratoperidinii]|uniref:RNA 2',3'-cyclic phosphodiesterase n=1 Tax=Gymnodinialimonas ceratoperidinii TaxID=2856823 RepID=A0A8F6TVZ0_9RHOB|nr:RNA 2',3'-cyclic phosphodiesterase [Gymnodinialimonas ceratoperidinii]QXT39705.1 RNA 2',3'-cyclic phosphodiesterase [Gymnodinialimonas ceratoperidinii]
MRAFLALPLAEPAIEALLSVQSTLPTGRPVPEDNLHLTLAYLGETSGDVLETLHDLLDAARLPAAEVSFDGLDTFAEMERGLTFASVASSESLVALQAKVAQFARQAGADLPRRRFRPHVTLTRANRQPKGPARDRLAAAISQRIEVPGFTALSVNLYESHLGPTGARHEVLASYPLS